MKIKKYISLLNSKWNQIRSVLLISFLYSIFAAIAVSGESNHKRVVSLAPSLTEFLYEFNLGDLIVGVTRFCQFPNQAQNKPSTGGLSDPNFEMIYRLNPDIILLNEGATSHKKKFIEMNLNTLETQSTSIAGILDSISTLGEVFNKSGRARELREKIQHRISMIREQTQNLPKPRVLLIYWRELGKGMISEVYIAGNNTFFNDLIKICGGRNAYSGEKRIISPVISAEGLLEMDPDVIIEIKGMLHKSGYSVETVLKDWDNLCELNAYKSKKIFILHNQYIGIPGPRIDLTMRDLVKCLHPELNFNE